MQGILYEEPTIWAFLIATLAIGGWTAWRTGQSTAGAWSPLTALLPQAFLLACAVRFIHMSVFGGRLLSLQFFIIDFLFILAVAALAYRVKRASQMATQYAFAYQRSGWLSWMKK